MLDAEHFKCLFNHHYDYHCGCTAPDSLPFCSWGFAGAKGTNRPLLIGLTLPLSFPRCSPFCLQIFRESRHLTSGHSPEPNYLPIGFGPQNWEEKHRVSVFASHISAITYCSSLSGQPPPKGKYRSLLGLRRQQRPLAYPSLRTFPCF